MPSERRKNKKYLTEYIGYLLDGSIITGAKFLLDQQTNQLTYVKPKSSEF